MDTSSSPQPLFDRVATLADAMRGRILLVLERHEMTVGELCAVFQLPQSSMSRQLKLLGDDRWVVWRAEGARRRYRMMPERLDESARGLWSVIRTEVERLPASEQDAQRVRSVLAERRTSRDFFSAAATEWDRMRAELFGRRLDLQSLAGLLDPEWVVGDLGCGTGEITQALAPFVRRIVAVDESPEMLEAARGRVGELPCVELRSGRLESLPIADEELDAAVIFLVLHYLEDPGAAIMEAARVLADRGRLLIVDMAPHDRAEYRQSMGHLWQGFSADRMQEWIRRSGLEGFRYVNLPPDPEARGPALFTVSARKPARDLEKQAEDDDGDGSTSTLNREDLS